MLHGAPELHLQQEGTLAYRLTGAVLVSVSLALGLSACSSPEPHGPSPTQSSGTYVGPNDLNNPEKRRVAEGIISSFENSTTEIQYGYVEDINDGRGITAGRAGFTSGKGDLLQVVEQYEQDVQKPDNPLAKYLGPLRAVDGTDSTEGLDGFAEAWQQTSRDDPALNAAQDKIYNKLYFEPAMRHAKEAGVRTALGQLVILDTMIQQGDGNDVDGLPHLIDQTNSAIGPAEYNEAVWIGRFLLIRQYHLSHAADPATAEAWRQSVPRVDALASFLATRNLDLNTPISWTVYGDKFTL